MKPKFFFVAVAMCTEIVWAQTAGAQTIRSFFSPRGGCTAATVAAIDSAQTSIDAAAYQFTSDPIAEALIRAARRGVRVRILTDRAQENSTDTAPRKIRAAGLDFRVDAAEKLQHNKYTVIDHRLVLTGSFNWSDNAEVNNAENLLIIDDPKTGHAFAQDFAKHYLHSRPYRPRNEQLPPHFQPRRHFHPHSPAPTMKGPLLWHA